ncbi:MAG TPA: TMEM165/GDT1 family protein [Acidimicrobiales bacterium]|nr:TMEM165/GDT1 family protein [Acidimicrobiales bacterium]
MNLGLAAATFAIVIPAELPDKTFISCVVLGARYRPLPVWCGAAAALVLQAGVGAAAGRLVGLAPHRLVQGVVAALFVAGGAYLVLGSEAREEREGLDIAEEDRGEIELVAAPSDLRIALTTFGVVALAELGDLTQVVIANLSARYDDALAVFAGASLALVLVSAFGVAAGRTIVRVVPLALVRRISGLVLLGLGVASAVAAAGA